MSKLIRLGVVSAIDSNSSQIFKSIYPFYRTLTAAYFLVVALYCVVTSPYGFKVYIFLTYWAFIFLALSQVVAAFNVWRYHQRNFAPDTIILQASLPASLAIQWKLHSVTSAAALIVSALFWAIIYKGQGVTFENLHTHGVNCAFVLIDLFISNTPSDLRHTWTSLKCALIYFTFTLIYWLLGGTNHRNEPFIYRILDYSGHPVKSLVYACSVAIVLTPLAHLWIHLLTKLRQAAVPRGRTQSSLVRLA